MRCTIINIQTQHTLCNASAHDITCITCKLNVYCQLYTVPSLYIGHWTALGRWIIVPCTLSSLDTHCTLLTLVTHCTLSSLATQSIFVAHMFVCSDLLWWFAAKGLRCWLTLACAHNMDNNEQNVYKILSKIFTEYLHSTIYFFNAHALAHMAWAGAVLLFLPSTQAPYGPRVDPHMGLWEWWSWARC